MLRSVVFALVWVLAGLLAAQAAERIERFDVTIDVDTGGDITVTETIEVTAEGDQIRRGIFRDLPRYFSHEGSRLAYDYDVESVTRGGEAEPYSIERVGNAVRVRVGDADVLLPRGRQTYELRYRVKNQVRYFDDYDELYWNVTGTYWAFPIQSARARITLPGGAGVLQMRGYTGVQGAVGNDYRYTQSGGGHEFQTTRPLGAGEGLTVALGFEKGLVDPPSMGERQAVWWARYGSLVILVASLVGVFGYYYRSFDRIGRDPVKGPVFARYEPPECYSPAGVHHIFYRGLRGHNALIATLTSLAVKGRLTIDAEKKRSITLTPDRRAEPKRPLDADDQSLEARLFKAGAVTLRGQYSSSFTRAYKGFRMRITKAYGRPYFRWNRLHAVPAIIISALIAMLVMRMTIDWTGWHAAGLLVLAGVNLAFLYFLPAPTRKGQEVRGAIEGFRLYLDTAEKLQLNAAEPGSDAPPPMTTERYETFLPYAIALGVEKPWTKYFEHALPEEAKAYVPYWTTGGHHGSLHALNQAVVSNISSGVTSAMPQSSGSSGSGGGGFSGGGGGGGGGGGW